MKKTLKYYFPELVWDKLPDFFESEAPAEVFATCNNCPMTEECMTKTSFNTKTKCCTYFPNLPNYLVGGVLQDSEMSGRQTLKDYIAEKKGAYPDEVSGTRKYWMMYNNSEDFFGKSESLLCPYYQKDTGGCGIWKYRNGVCATWFCKHSYSEAGTKFWNTLLSYIGHLEKSLNLYCTNKAKLVVFDRAEKPTWRELDELPLLREDQDKYWQHYDGKEEEFYKECYDWVKGLSSDQLNEVIGARGESLLLQLQYAYNQVMVLPPRLKFDADSNYVRLIEGDLYRVKIGEIDVEFTIPVGALKAFDEVEYSDLKDFQQHVLDKHKYFYTKELIRILYHYEVLKTSD